jgi:hypothetical protein
LWATACGALARVDIALPLDGQHFARGDTVRFACNVNSSVPLAPIDAGDYQWTSSLDGSVGNERSFFKSDLSPGKHVIVVRVQNSRDFDLRDVVTIFVEQP